MGLSTIISTPEFVADVYDPQRNVIHIIDSDGTIRDWSLASQSFTATFGIGPPPEPTSIAITADGADLLIGISSPVVTSAPGAATTTYAAVVDRVSLTTHAVDQIEFSVPGRLDGVAHIAVAADGTALVSTADFSGEPIQEFNAEAANPTVTAAPGLAVGSGPDDFLASSTAQHLIIQPTGDSTAPLQIFSSGVDSVTASTALSHFGATGLNAGQGDYNEAKALLVDFTTQNIVVLHADTLALDQDLSSFQSNGAVGAAAFDPSGDHLFLWDQPARAIEVLDTTTWQEVGTLTVHGLADGSLTQMQVIDSGQALMLQLGPDGIEIVDLTQGFNETTGGNALINGTAYDDSLVGGAGTDSLNGQDGPDTLSGGDGDDSLSGGAGDDAIVGGPGADTLSGGSGADVFVFDQTNDSPAAAGLGGHLEKIDHITDWTAQDFLQISADVAATTGNFEATTSSDYATAESLAQSEAAHGIHFLAAQIGSDVIVFAPSEGLAIDLVGASLNSIGPSNIGPTSAATSPPDDGDGGVIVTFPFVSLPTDGSGGDGSGDSGSGGVSTNILVQTTTPTDNNDFIVVSAGQTEIHGGEGADTLQGTTLDDYLRGDDGDDSLQGGTAFDDINGNKGDDTIDGGSGGSDWLVGGQGDDSVTAHHSANILYGNLGNDTLHSGDGADVIRGGQGDDSIVGGSGNDFISGDRGNDTESGGAGADIFHGSQDAGIDRVLDFSQAEGDRVELDAGTTYTLTQVGADTVIDMGSGNQMILAGVQLSSLKDGWIFEG